MNVKLFELTKQISLVAVKSVSLRNNTLSANYNIGSAP